jgi:hypothetical protein
MTTATRRKTVTRRDADRVLAALCHQYGITPGEPGAPVLIPEWDFLTYGNPAPFAIVWEEGPYEWAYRFPEGGIDEEATYEIQDLAPGTVVRTAPAKIDRHIFTEAITSWAVGLYLA